MRINSINESNKPNNCDEILKPYFEYFENKSKQMAELELEIKMIKREISNTINNIQPTIHSSVIFDKASNIFYSKSIDEKQAFLKEMSKILKFVFRKSFDKYKKLLKLDTTRDIISYGYYNSGFEIPLLYKSKQFALYIAQPNQYNLQNPIKELEDLYVLKHHIFYYSSCCTSVYKESYYDILELDELLCNFIEDIENKRITIFNNKK